MKRTIISQAPAKINIGLWVKNKRSDGYHEISTVMQTLSLADIITVKEISEPGIRIYCDNPDIPCDQHNLVHRAAMVFLDYYEIEPAIAINIEKKIPVSAGLGGGSSDAAAIFWSLAKMYDKAIPVKDMMNLAAKVGSDVPFLLHGGLAVATGRGEQLSFYEPPRPPMVVVIIMPAGVRVSTKWAYENYTPGNDEIKERAFTSIMESYRRKDINKLKKLVFNDLESVTLQRHPEVARLKELLSSNGDGVVLMSGSGPAVFGIFPDKKSAMNSLKPFHGEQVEVFIEQISRKHT